MPTSVMSIKDSCMNSPRLSWHFNDHVIHSFLFHLFVTVCSVVLQQRYDLNSKSCKTFCHRYCLNRTHRQPELKLLCVTFWCFFPLHISCLRHQYVVGHFHINHPKWASKQREMGCWKGIGITPFTLKIPFLQKPSHLSFWIVSGILAESTCMLFVIFLIVAHKGG